MRIFVLDDDMHRIKWFKKAFSGDNVYYAHDPIEAERMLRDHEYDIIYLDHDLGGPYTRGPKGDGIDLAEAMAKHKLHIDTPIVVHSLNHEGSEDILATLKHTHNTLFRIDFLRLKKLDVEVVNLIIDLKLKPFRRGK